MPSSTSAGVLGMTRTTGVAGRQRRLDPRRRHAGGDRDDEVPGVDVLGEQAEQDVDVLRLDREQQHPGAARPPRPGRRRATPYRSASCAARSGLRSQTRMPSGPPRRTSPDSSASPIFPPPMMASPRRPVAVTAGRQARADSAAAPARGHGDADGVAAGHQPPLLVGRTP